MGSASEPPRKIDVSKWNSTWDRIRATQAKQRAEAVASELREADPHPIPEHLPPLPPGTRYGGVLDDYPNGSPVQGHVFVDDGDVKWSDRHGWLGTKGCPPLRQTGDPVWHIAIPIDEQP